MRKNRYENTPPEEQPRPDTALLESRIVNKPLKGVEDREPVVTVVTAVFNAIKEGRKDELLQCLNSVQNQTGVMIEHVIVDGASSDGTVDLIKNYDNTKYPIRLLSEPDAGIYDAMNRGLWLARGKYVIFLNSDDYYSNPNGLSESVKRLEETGADFSYAPVTVLSETTGLPVPHLISHPNVNLIFVEMPFSHQSIMLRRAVMMEINGFDLRYSSGADYDSILRLIFTGHRACLVPMSFVAFRLGGFSYIYMEHSQKEVGTIFSRLYKKYLGVELSPEEGKKIYLLKQNPKELIKKQLPIAQAAFGDAIDAIHNDDNNDLLQEDLLMMRLRLQVIKNNPRLLIAIRIIAKVLITSPVLFCRFLLLFCLYYTKMDKKAAGKQAFFYLFSKQQEKRKKMCCSSPGEKPQRSVPFSPRTIVTHQDAWHLSGLYMSELWGAWTPKTFSVFFQIPEKFVSHSLKVQVNIGGYVFPESPKRIIDIGVNGHKIGTVTVENVMPQPYFFIIPADIVSNTLDIDFTADKTFCPASIENSTDTRELGMTFQQLSITEMDSSDGELQDPAKQQEIRVGFLNHFNKWWVGGITYFKNLFQAMETTESPHLKPFIFRSPDELADCLLPYVSIFPDPVPSTPNHFPTAADYHVDVLSHLNGNQVSEGRDGIAWISDFQHVHLPEMFDEQEIAFRNHSFHTLIEQNRIVCLSSYDAMEDFKNYAPEFAYKARCLHFVSIPEPAVYQISPEEAAEIRSSRQLPERYFYVPNQFWKHKNHITVLQAIAALKKNGLSIHVVFSGNTIDARFPHYFEELQSFCRQEQIEENVHFLGLIPLKEVYFLMRDSLAMINPSRFEGWSSSVEEAKSIGKTIFLSNLNVHYEQMPPHGTYFPCDDPLWLADLLKRAWNELKSGPDSAMEEKAREQLPLRIKQFGKEFQRIILDALENTNSCEKALQSAPKVTVITSVFNLLKNGKEQQILRNLGSVAAQKGLSIEHLIVDSGSTDGTLEFLKPHAEKYGCNLISETGHGIYEALNRGIILATGKYVTTLDADSCYTADDFLQNSVAALEQGNFDFSYAPVTIQTPDGNPVSHIYTTPDETRCITEMPFCRQAMLFLRKTLYSVAGFNDTFRTAGDFDLLLRLILSAKKAVKVECTGCCVTLQQSSQKDNELVQQEYVQIYTRLYSRLGFAMTPDAGNLLYTGKQLPDTLRTLLQPILAKTFSSNQQCHMKDAK